MKSKLMAMNTWDRRMMMDWKPGMFRTWPEAIIKIAVLLVFAVVLVVIALPIVFWFVDALK